MQKVGWWTGERPPRGLHTKRDRRFAPDRYCAIAQNVVFDEIGIRRRPGFIKRHRSSLTRTCLRHDGTTHYIAIPHHASLNLATAWTVEKGIFFRYAIPTSDRTL